MGFMILRMGALLARNALEQHRLGIAVVGPMFGGSLPIAGYLERAFRNLGHRTLLVLSTWPTGMMDNLPQSAFCRSCDFQILIRHHSNQRPDRCRADATGPKPRLRPNVGAAILDLGDQFTHRLTPGLTRRCGEACILRNADRHVHTFPVNQRRS